MPSDRHLLAVELFPGELHRVAGHAVNRLLLAAEGPDLGSEQCLLQPLAELLPVHGDVQGSELVMRHRAGALLAQLPAPVVHEAVVKSSLEGIQPPSVVPHPVPQASADSQHVQSLPAQDHHLVVVGESNEHPLGHAPQLAGLAASPGTSPGRCRRAPARLASAAGCPGRSGRCAAGALGSGRRGRGLASAWLLELATAVLHSACAAETSLSFGPFLLQAPVRPSGACARATPGSSRLQRPSTAAGAACP